MCIFQSGRGYDPTMCIMDEAAYMHPSAVASAMTYATNRGVTIFMLCSPADANHWFSNMDQIVDGLEKGVCLISLCYLCEECAQKGVTGVCVHGSLSLPFHIEAGKDVSQDPVHQLMEFISPGSYQKEICGYNNHTKSLESEVFSHESLQKLLNENWKDVSEMDQRSVSSILVGVDPVQAGASVSGIGIAFILEIGEVYSVCILSFFSFNPKIVLPRNLE